jgi:hypothetical protein
MLTNLPNVLLGAYAILSRVRQQCKLETSWCASSSRESDLLKLSFNCESSSRQSMDPWYTWWFFSILWINHACMYVHVYVPKANSKLEAKCLGTFQFYWSDIVLLLNFCGSDLSIEVLTVQSNLHITALNYTTTSTIWHISGDQKF